MTTLTYPGPACSSNPARLEEIKRLAEESQGYPAPLPIIIPVPSSGPDEDVEDLVSNQVFSTLYNSDRYSDLVIRCQDRVWRVHRAIVCVQSKVLAAAVDGPFREGITSEIDLSEDDPEIVEHMISYLYKGYYDFGNPISSLSYTPAPSPTQERKSWLWPTTNSINNHTLPPPAGSSDITPYYASSQSNKSNTIFPAPQSKSGILPSTKTPYPSRLLTHASVYCLAEQYNIPRLKNHALCKYATLVPTAWQSPFFIPSIKLIYDNTPSLTTHMDDLRAVAVRTAAEHSKDLLQKIEFLETCTENGEIAVDVLKASLDLKIGEVGVSWKVKKACSVDPKHDLVYIPVLPGFGLGSSGRTNLMGFGSTTRGRYKCASCRTFVD